MLRMITKLASLFIYFDAKYSCDEKYIIGTLVSSIN